MPSFAATSSGGASSEKKSQEGLEYSRLAYFEMLRGPTDLKNRWELIRQIKGALVIVGYAGQESSDRGVRAGVRHSCAGSTFER